MNPIRLMGKLTAKGVVIDGAGGGGGPVAVAAEDVAGALGMGRLPAEAVLVGRAKFCDDAQAQLSLAAWVKQALRRQCLQYGWKTDYCDGLATLCVFELVHPMRCSDCVGRGYQWSQTPRRGRQGDLRAVASRWFECDKCKGSGQAKLTVRSRAAVAGITKSRFSETWSGRADEMMKTLWSLEDRVLRHLWQQFSDWAA